MVTEFGWAEPDGPNHSELSKPRQNSEPTGSTAGSEEQTGSGARSSPSAASYLYHNNNNPPQSH